jgi:hypothetical protein
VALTTLADLKTYLGISDSSEDDLLNLLIADADAAILGYIGRTIEQATLTEFYSGDGTQMLVLKQRPVTTVTSVHVDQSGYSGQGSGAFDSTTEWTAGEDFYIRTVVENESNTGELVAIKGPGTFTADHQPKTWGEWPLGTGNIKVVYTAGYSTVPSDLAGACRMLVSWMRASRDNGRAIESEKLGSYSYKLMDDDGVPELATVKGVCNRYRNMILI